VLQDIDKLPESEKLHAFAAYEFLREHAGSAYDGFVNSTKNLTQGCSDKVQELPLCE
jgi:hypothetical protein